MPQANPFARRRLRFKSITTSKGGVGGPTDDVQSFARPSYHHAATLEPLLHAGFWRWWQREPGDSGGNPVTGSESRVDERAGVAAGERAAWM